MDTNLSSFGLVRRVKAGDSAALDRLILRYFPRLRRWARENYVPASQRDMQWHPIVLDEMRRKDAEGREAVLAS